MYYCNYDVLYHFYIFYKILNIDSYIDSYKFIRIYKVYKNLYIV